MNICHGFHCVKNVQMQSFPGPYFPPFGLNTEIYGVNLRILFQCEKMPTRKTPYLDTFWAVLEPTFLNFFWECVKPMCALTDTNEPKINSDLRPTKPSGGFNPSNNTLLASISSLGCHYLAFLFLVFSSWCAAILIVTGSLEFCFPVFFLVYNISCFTESKQIILFWIRRSICLYLDTECPVYSINSIDCVFDILKKSTN